MRRVLLGITLAMIAVPVLRAQEYDDIYYNPKKSTTSQKSQRESAYISDFSNVDVDTYNRRGETYYSSPVDTIGATAQAGEDFVYTSQIQKYYNPTIVIDNSDVLGDILNNSYGNVEIVIDNGYPTFVPVYSYNPYWYPTSWRYSWTWGPSFTWSWCLGPSWTWGPTWAWDWGPSWTWGPAWGWGYGPGYYPWGPAYRPGRPYYADYRPGGHRPVGPRPGWSHNTRPGYANGRHDNTRPGYNYAGGTSNRRPSYTAGSNSRPGSNTGAPQRNPNATTSNRGQISASGKPVSSGHISSGVTQGVGTGVQTRPTLKHNNHSVSSSAAVSAERVNGATGVSGVSGTTQVEPTRNGNATTGTPVLKNNNRVGVTGQEATRVERMNSNSNTTETRSYNSNRNSNTNRNYNSNSNRSYNSNANRSYNSNSNRSYNSNSNRSYNSNSNRSYNSNSNRSYNSNSNRSYNSNRGSSYNSGRSYNSRGSGMSGGHRGGGGGGRRR